MEPITQPGFRFRFDPTVCRTCGGRCCNGESGRVSIEPEEALAMARLSSMPVETFTARYLYRQGDRLCIREIREGSNYACALYDKTIPGCSVYAARPRQCQTFPFWERFRQYPSGQLHECPGVVPNRVQ